MTTLQKDGEEFSWTCWNTPCIREGEIRSSGLPWIQEDWWCVHFIKCTSLEKKELALTAAKREVYLLIKEM